MTLSQAADPAKLKEFTEIEKRGRRRCTGAIKLTYLLRAPRRGSVCWGPSGCCRFSGLCAAHGCFSAICRSNTFSSLARRCPGAGSAPLSSRASRRLPQAEHAPEMSRSLSGPIWRTSRKKVPPIAFDLARIPHLLLRLLLSCCHLPWLLQMNDYGRIQPRFKHIISSCPTLPV
jgi:hypothetical protein